MKTLTLFFFFVFATAFTAHAQITEGNWMVGGSANYGFSEAESSGNGFTSSGKSSGFTILPNIGYFVKDKLVIGAIPSFPRYR